MWLETSNEVYAVIFAKHRKQWQLYISWDKNSVNREIAHTILAGCGKYDFRHLSHLGNTRYTLNIG